MYKEIKKALDSRFIETEKVARILSIAIDGEKNCILHGPAGHGKSEMTEHVLTSLGHRDDTYIYSFGEGMSEDLLWGGIDYKTLARMTNSSSIPKNPSLISNTPYLKKSSTRHL